MRRQRTCVLLTLLTLLVVGSPTLVAGPKGKQEVSQSASPRPNPQIAKWISQLNSDRFKVRDQATQALVKAGSEALPAVLKATLSKLPEVRNRAFGVLAAISESSDTPTSNAALRAAEKISQSPDRQRAAKATQIVESVEQKAIRYFRSTERNVSAHPKYRQKRQLVLRGKITDADWRQLVKLRTFKTLWLHSKEATDADLARLNGLDKLVTLDLFSSTRITGPGLVHLAHLPALRSLALPKGFPASGLRYLKDLDGLTELSIHYTSFKDDAGGLAHLKELDGLERLTISSTDILDAALAPLANLTRLKSLNLWNNEKMSDAGLVHLKNLKRLETVSLPYRIRGAGLKHLTGAKRLQTLSLIGNRISEEGLRHIGQMSNLESLNLSWTLFNDAGFAHLRGLTVLKKLDLQGSAVTDAGLAHLKKLKALERLDIDSTKITDAGLAHLAELQNLHWLNVQRTSISDAAVPHLQKMKNLRFLNPIDTRLTERGKKTLRKALPKLIIDIDAPP